MCIRGKSMQRSSHGTGLTDSATGSGFSRFHSKTNGPGQQTVCLQTTKPATEPQRYAPASVSTVKINLRRLSWIFPLCGIIAPLVISITVTIAGLQNPGYSQFTNTVSTLGAQGSKSPGLLITGLVIYGVLSIGFAYGLHLRLQNGTKARIAWFAITLYGIGMVLAGVFRTTPTGSPPDMEGILHNASVITACLALLIGAWMFAASVHNNAAWFGFTRFTIAATFLGLALAAVFPFHTALPFAGIFERVFYGVIVLWIETVSVWLFRLELKRQK